MRIPGMVGVGVLFVGALLNCVIGRTLRVLRGCCSIGSAA